MEPWNESLNFIFPTTYVIPKSLKFSHWPSKKTPLKTNRNPPWWLESMKISVFSTESSAELWLQAGGLGKLVKLGCNLPKFKGHISTNIHRVFFHCKVNQLRTILAITAIFATKHVSLQVAFFFNRKILLKGPNGTSQTYTCCSLGRDMPLTQSKKANPIPWHTIFLI